MRRIEKAAVLGAGVMGATIAAHLANAGIRVLLLDIVPQGDAGAGTGGGAASADRVARTRVASSGLDALTRMKPAALYLPEYAACIEPGNFEDDARRIAECDWVIEAVVENMAIKKKLLAETVVPNLSEGAILSTNTSGLSVNDLARALPEAVRRNFLVTHFFNPPRYMRLVEIVSGDETDPAAAAFMADFIGTRLGKGVVYAKDTPNFIANRIGVYSLYNCIRRMTEMRMTVEEVDVVAGPATARPGSAAFRTADLVGIDTLMHVGKNSFDLLLSDPEREIFRPPAFLAEMAAKGLLGNKTRQGFYKKAKAGDAATRFFYDYATGGYAECRRPTFPSVDAAKAIDDPAERLRAVVSGRDKGALFAWKNLRDTLLYSFNRIPEISGDIVNVDNAMKWGFNWELGPFEMLDAIGAGEFARRAAADGVNVPDRLGKIDRFYRFEGGRALHFDMAKERYDDVPAAKRHVNLRARKRGGALVETNRGASIVDLGDGVFCLEFHSKMNAIGNDILSMVRRAVGRAEADGVGLVIANQGSAFSAGANLMLLAATIAEGEFDDVALTVKNFQKATMAVKYGAVPVVAAPHNVALGGGCEICLHADAMNPHAETYMGLVEIGVGLLPAGGGTKEMAVRAIRLADEYGTDVSPFLIRNFMNIATARVSTSAAELRQMGFLGQGDAVTMNIDNLISDAKRKVVALSANYRPSRPMTGLKAPGRSVAATIRSQLWNMKAGGFITEYEERLGATIAHVITGGDVPGGTPITEQYLLDLEREAFLALCGEKRTLDRIRHMLKKGKPLRN